MNAPDDAKMMTPPHGPTCFVHIGPHKTGSSSLKHFLRANEAELATRGLVFPQSRDARGKRARNHFVLAQGDEIEADGTLTAGAQFWPEIDAVTRGSRANILVSSEFFATMLAQDDRLDRFLTFFETRGYGVRILAYVRDQPAWLNSWFVQGRKRLSRPESFDAFVDEMLGAGRVEPGRYLQPFLSNPRCSVEVIPFERAAAAGLEDDFLRRCGIEETASLGKTPIRNVNAGAKTVYAAGRIIERLGRSPRDHDNYARIYRDFKVRTRELGWDRQPHVEIDDRAAEAIRARLAASNELFARRHFGEAWKAVCPPRALTPSVFDPANAAPGEAQEVEDVIDVFVELFSRKRRGKRASAR